MVLATTTFEDYERFMEVFTTLGAEKRKEHGCKSAHIFRDPNDDDRIWRAVFDWDEEGWKSFVSDPTVPPIMQQAGHKGRPQTASFDVHLDA
jgi:quinol monooxygenase YgiN